MMSRRLPATLVVFPCGCKMAAAALDIWLHILGRNKRVKEQYQQNSGYVSLPEQCHTATLSCLAVREIKYLAF